MRALKLIVNVLFVIVVLPVAIVGILGMLLSPFQTVARATEPHDMVHVSDLMLSEAVAEPVERTLAERAALAERVAGAEAADAPESAERVDELEPNHEAEQFSAADLNDVPDADDAVYAVYADDASDADDDIAAYGAADADDGAYADGASEDTVAVNAADAGNRGSVSDMDEAGWQGGNAESVSSYEEPGVGEAQSQGGYYSSEQLRDAGVINDGGVSYTWYSQQVLPGGGLNIEGRHVSDEGYIVDGQDRIVVASSDLPYGTELSVPFGGGTAVVLDTGCAPGIVDVYTDF